MHKLLVKQLQRARCGEGQVDLDRLCTLVSSAYDDDERDRQRIARANRLMGEEIDEAHRRLEAVVDSLQVQNTRFEAALENMSQGLCMFDVQQRLAVCNRRFAAMFGLDAAAQVGRRLVEAHSDCDPQGQPISPYLALMHSARRTALQRDCTDGRILVVTHEPLPDGGCVQTYDDVTAWRLADARMARMASHDALTDLPNRVLLRDRIDNALATRAADRHVALMCLDLDRFKAVNDSLGHPAGDALLLQVTQRLRQHVRASDTIARLGGDEFAILLDQLSPVANPEELAERLVHAIEQPYDLDGQTANIGVSIGIALAPRDGEDAVTLVKRADLALYNAKASGRGRHSFFDPAMDEAAQDRRTLEIDLRRALEVGEFELHYQPLLHVNSQQVSGFEALLRWRHPQRGLVPPGDFIPMAEDLGLIVPIGDWVLRRACRDAAQWPTPLRVAVNVSARQFTLGQGLVDSVRTALADAGLRAERLELEITESVLMDHNAATLEVLHALRGDGVHIVMDDFGIGYSSLAYLRSFPFDKVKIDRSFVHEVSHKADALAIIRAVSGLCSSLGIASTAEGVETAEQLNLVAREDCTEVQGYLFSRPVPEGDIPTLLARLAGLGEVALAVVVASGQDS
ncbi:putative bifunctional diguanylate cyclase/phosphodiesterase [Sphaerotilus microaerophilus]|uniref:EAL domain-containing protein n=1 Tax=Sphaerotilus microaerophilus TaxID=2914710 RepID=A0ABN6PM26_9BURK|nr:EAL domain-containing protein [Sphaerotilus sp. FB-5]BDI05603.1 hypothetical protein CATMQ487_25730 [Sphaerotilus sp. FB-5]